MKKIMFLITVILVLIGSIFLMDQKEEKEQDNEVIEDIIFINGKQLSINYLTSNQVNEEISYNNISEKIIKIQNDNDEDIIYALEFISNNKENVVYSLSASVDNVEYKKVYENINIYDALGYNLVVNKNSTVYLKIEFKSIKEDGTLLLNGELNIIENITDREKVLFEINSIKRSLSDKISSINGINGTGIYLIDIKELNNTNINGYILIDALDLTNVEYYVYASNDQYSINGKNMNDLKKSNVQKVKKTYDFNGTCKSYNQGECLEFKKLKYSDNNMKIFYDKSLSLVKSTIKEIKITDKKTYLIDLNVDIKNSTNIRGYIIADNTKEETEYYLFLTDNSFMISGYNYTKLGEYTLNSNTIRTYNKTAFDLASKDGKTTCNFVGFTECYSLDNNII